LPAPPFLFLHEPCVSTVSLDGRKPEKQPESEEGEVGQERPEDIPKAIVFHRQSDRRRQSLDPEHHRNPAGENSENAEHPRRLRHWGNNLSDWDSVQRTRGLWLRRHRDRDEL
jgi:hypothetical protein